jgi:hypothetical protein
MILLQRLKNTKSLSFQQNPLNLLQTAIFNSGIAKNSSHLGC